MKEMKYEELWIKWMIRKKYHGKMDEIEWMKRKHHNFVKERQQRQPLIIIIILLRHLNKLF